MLIEVLITAWELKLKQFRKNIVIFEVKYFATIINIYSEAAFALKVTFAKNFEKIFSV